MGDFAWYDHVLTTSLLLGNVPARHQNKDGSIDIDTLFRIGRGRAPTGEPAAAAEMTKWFNTNYHYMVPEFVKGQQFKLSWTQLLDEVDEALALGHKIKPVLLGPHRTYAIRCAARRADAFPDKRYRRAYHSLCFSGLAMAPRISEITLTIITSAPITITPAEIAA